MHRKSGGVLVYIIQSKRDRIQRGGIVNGELSINMIN